MSRLRLNSLLLIVLLVWAVAATAQHSESAFKLHSGDRVVFYGDSITDQRLYTTFVEDYIATRFPQLKIDFVHSGWGGDTVNGGGGGPINLRLQRDVIAYKPTVVTIMLGMNDGRYRAFDPAIFDIYRKGYQHILHTIQAALPEVRFLLIQPSPYDDVTRAPSFAPGYNTVLVRYGQFVQELAQTNNAAVVDLNTPVVALLQKANALNAETAQKILPDRIHPGSAGHLIMAEAILKAWKAPSLVTDVEVDAIHKTVVRARNCQVHTIEAGKALTWTETDNALPMPVTWYEPVTALALQSSDFTDALDRERLRVTGLTPETRYALTIDGKDVGEFTGDQLATGINLATLSTPMTQQAAKVCELVAQHNDQHFQRWRTIQVPLGLHNNRAVQQALPALLTGLDAEEATTVAQQRAAAQPTTHRYAITTALPDPSGPNLALKKPYTTSAPNLFNWGIGGLTDGSWAANAEHTFATDNVDLFPKTATVDLQDAAILGSVRVGVPPFGSTETVRVSVSLDGRTFTEVGSYVFSLRHEEQHLFKFAPQRARYVRLTYPDHYATEVDYQSAFMFTTEVEAYAPGQAP